MIKQIFKKIIVSIITAEAKLVLKKYKPLIVAITGSVGKTSTKDAIFTMLDKKFSTESGKVRKSQKSFNSEIGAPLVVLGCENAWLNPFRWLSNIFKGLKLMLIKSEYPEWLVLELGVERPNDMENLVSWIKPHVVVITALTDIPSHVEFFKGPEEVAKEKAKILKNLTVDDFVVLNNDDENVSVLKEKTKAKVFTYGFAKGADLASSDYRILPTGISFKINAEGASVPIRVLNSFGKHHVYPILAALAVGKSLGFNYIEMADFLIDYEAPPGRLKLLDGVKNTYILDDTYNSSPVALRAALDTVKDMEAKRKIVVLGDMLELGDYTIEAHKSVARDIISTGIEIVFTVGPRAKFFADGLKERGFNEKNIFQFATSETAAKPVEEFLKEGDLVLVKGSQGMRMEKIVEEIMAHPEQKKQLLVRQEQAWLNK